MKIFAISDLHLSTAVEKPMDIFGDGWLGHFDKIKEDWNNKVSDDDLVLIGGDTSWGSNLDEAESDLIQLKDLKGKKIVLRGNHDYWWNSLSKISSRFPYLNFLQNNCYAFDGFIVCGSRGWNIANENSSDEDKKIYERELMRLELSIKQAIDKQKNGEALIALLHYPPFEADFKDTAVTKLLEQYGVSKVIYGHLHGKEVRVKPRYVKNGIEYILTSCDLIDFKLVEVKL